MRWAKRIAQAAPAPDPSQPADSSQPAGDQPPPADATGEQPTPAEPTSDQPQPAPAPEGAQQLDAPAEPAPGLSDEELQKLAEEEAKTEVITVTGSLINRKEVDSPSPVSVVDRQKLDSAGITNVGDVLQKIPSQGNAINAQNNNGGDGSTRINLRSLGAARTLVLMNGRRVVSSGTGADSSVDFGTIPLAMIERVEVLKDGASAIYGSDAVAGVVNIITRSDLNGTEASIYTSTSQQGDGENYDLSFVTGHSSNKGNITFSGGFQEQKPVLAGERDFSRQTYTYIFCDLNDPDCAPSRALTGSSASATGRINTMPNGQPVITIPGCTTRFCTADGTGGFRNYVLPTEDTFGDNYNFQPLNYLATPSTRLNLFSNGRYDITKNIHAFFEGQFNNRKSTQQLAEEPVFTSQTGTPISIDNAYNPTGVEILDYNRRLTEFGPRIFNQEVNTSRLVVGLNGTIPEAVPVVKNWKWEASYNYGRTDATSSLQGSLILSHLRNALGPSFRDTDGSLRCGVLGAPIDGCVPLNLLDPGNVTQDQIDYLTFTGTNSGFNQQDTAQVTASGKLFDLPNRGDVSIALGGSYRKEQGGYQPDPLTSTGDTTGNATEPTRGSYDTFEGFGELSVVPYSGGDAVKWVELNAAGRAYRYNTFGSGVTGKLSGLVRTAGGVAVRGTFGNAFRAPNVAELFSGQADGFPLVEDPCDTLPPGATQPIMLSKIVADQCAKQGVPVNSTFGTSQQRGLFGGNPDLDPEEARVGTAGVVYEPLKGLDLTLDYWNIKVNDAITTLPVSTILAQCYEGGQDAFCDQIQRDPTTHAIDHIVDIIQNVGSLSTSGLDFSAAYQWRHPMAGTFRHALEGTYLFRYNIETGTINPATGQKDVIHGRGYYDLGVNPDLKINFFTFWSHPSGFGAGVNARFVNSFQECDQNDCNTPGFGRRDVEKYATGDLYVNYGLKTSQGRTNVTVGMNNVLDVSPPLIYNGPALNSDESVYDFMGRQFYIRLSQLF